MKILFVNSSRTNNLVGFSFIEKVSQIMAQYVAVEVINVTDVEPQILFDTLMAQNYDVLITYNRVMLADVVYLDDRPYNFFALLNRVHICFIVDHPVMSYEFLATHNPRRHSIFCSPSHQYFAEKIKLSGTNSSMIWGGDAMDKDAIVPHRLRPFDIVIAGMWKDPNQSLQLDASFSQLKEMVQGVIQYLDLDPYRDTYRAVCNYLVDHHIPLSEKDIISISKRLAIYIRDIDRLQFIERLVVTGFKILLIGNHWRPYIDAHFPEHKVTFMDALPRSEILEQYQKARVIACLNNTNGASERVFDGLNAGCMVLAEYSPILWEYFEKSSSVLFYSHQNADSVMCELQQILQAGSDLTEYYAKQAIDVMNAAHTWEHRVQHILEVCEVLLENTRAR